MIDNTEPARPVLGIRMLGEGYPPELQAIAVIEGLFHHCGYALGCKEQELPADIKRRVVAYLVEKYS